MQLHPWQSSSLEQHKQKDRAYCSVLFDTEGFLQWEWSASMADVTHNFAHFRSVKINIHEFYFLAICKNLYPQKLHALRYVHVYYEILYLISFSEAGGAYWRRLIEARGVKTMEALVVLDRACLAVEGINNIELISV